LITALSAACVAQVWQRNFDFPVAENKTLTTLSFSPPQKTSKQRIDFGRRDQLFLCFINTKENKKLKEVLTSNRKCTI